MREKSAKIVVTCVARDLVNPLPADYFLQFSGKVIVRWKSKPMLLGYGQIIAATIGEASSSIVTPRLVIRGKCILVKWTLVLKPFLGSKPSHMFYLAPQWLLFLLNLLKPTTYIMYDQFNIKKFCVLPTMHLCVLCGSQNKQRLFRYTA